MNLHFFLQIWHNYKVIKNSSFFDASWYKETYLKNSMRNPYLHFLFHGNQEKYDPSPNFSTYEYYLANPDAKKVKMNALLHYLLFGINEGREIIRLDRLMKRSNTVCKRKELKPYNKTNRTMNANIKIFVACKQNSYIPSNPLLFPIQTGAALTDIRFKNMLYDDIGDNISLKNESYAELTAQYWAWKNIDADYYGFFHNRRYLSFNSQLLKSRDNLGIEFENIDSYAIEKLSLIENDMRNLIEGYDIIVPRPFNWINSTELGINRTIEHQYKMSKEHNIDDLKMAIDILKNKYPDYSKIADKYLHSYEGYYLNIYIMKKDIFFSYCEWLFPMMEDFSMKLDINEKGTYGKRIIGYVAERLFGIYLTYLSKNNPDLRIYEAQNSFFKNITPPSLSSSNKKDINFLFFKELIWRRND